MGLNKANDFDVNQIKNNRNNKIIPTAPLDHEVGLMPDWLTVNSDLSQAKVMVTVDYNITEEDTAPVVDDAEANRLASNNLAEAKESETYTGNKSEFNYEPNYTRDSVKDWYLEDKCDGNLLEYQILQDHNGPHETGVTETQDEDDVFCETEAHNNKRKRTTTETSLPDIGGEHPTSKSPSVSYFAKSCQTDRSRSVSECDNSMKQCVCRRHSSNGKPMRKVKKGLGIAAWIVAPPVVLFINFMRTKDDYDDDDDKHNDPLRPWNYKVNYLSPHKR